MDIQQTAQELQKFADANGLNIDASVILSTMDAGDFIELNTAMDQSDNRSIMKILQKYKARVSETYKYFNGDVLTESKSLNHFISMGINELVEHYHQYVHGALADASHLTLAEMKALIYEDLTTSLKANQIVGRNVSQQQQQVNPQTQMKMKQAEIQRNANNQNFKVSVPGNQNGTTDVENVVGIDAGPTPQTSLVVTKNTNGNDLNVFGLDDIDPVNNGSQVNVQEGSDDPDYVMGPADSDHIEQSSSPLTHSVPSMGELMQTIGDIEDENLSGEESVEGNEAMHDQDEVIRQIIDFCSRLQGR